MEKRTEIRNIHLKSMLSERCSEPNALLEAVIKQTRRRGLLTPWQTPDCLRKTLGSNCTVVAFQRAHDIESPTKEELACIGIFLKCRLGKEDRLFVPTNHKWETAIAICKDELEKPHTSCLLSFNSRDCNSLCSWWQELPLLQEQSCRPCANPRRATICILYFHPACSNMYYFNAPETQNGIAETSKEPVHLLNWELGTLRLSFPSFLFQVT